MEGQIWRSRSLGRQRLKALEDDNAELKKLLAEAMHDNAMLKTSRQKMISLTYMVSERRAC
jgi:hypothetical protein